MARSFLALALAALVAAPTAFAQPTPTPVPPLEGDQPKPPAEKPPRPEGDRPKKDRQQDPSRRQFSDDELMVQKFRKKLEDMSPEERQRFKENLKRWKEMGEDERKDMQKRAIEERERVRKNVDEAIEKLGLKLDQDQREVFALRYRQERHKLEQTVCKEMDEKRKAGVEDILQRLKVEFSNPPKPAPAPAATPQ
jgi:hypothetical protein